MKTSLRSTILPLLLLTSTLASAAQAYIWVDSQGTTHFSESPPMDSAASATRVELQPAPVTPALPANRVETMNEQASRMQSSRRLREQFRDARRAAANDRQQEQTGFRDDSSEQQPERYPYGYYPHHPHDHHGHDPDHGALPPPRPRFVPGRTVTQKRNQKNLRQHQEQRLQ